MNWTIAIIAWGVLTTFGLLFSLYKLCTRSPENTVDLQANFNLIIQKLNKMAQEIEDLTAEVAETKGIMASAKILIEGFAAALAAAGTNPAKLKALRDDLNAGSEDLAAGIAANPLPGEVVEPPVEPPAEPPVE